MLQVCCFFFVEVIDVLRHQKQQHLIYLIEISTSDFNYISLLELFSLQHRIRFYDVNYEKLGSQ